MIVRRLATDELPLAVPLLAPEGWSLEPPELVRLESLGGAVGAFEGGRLVGFLTFIDTPPYRWIGNVAVSPAVRGRGVGARIVAEAMRGADRTALYSVEKAVTLYERAGLRIAGELHALRAEHARPGDEQADELARADVADAVALDRAATGMDRGALLRALLDVHPGRAVRRGGRTVAFGIAKTYYDVTEIGPVVAERPEDAWAVVDSLVRETPGPHDAAVHALGAGWTERGFTPMFRAIPMFAGGAPSWDLARYHAAAGLEKG